MSIEMKGLIAGLIAAAAVLGASFGLSALVRSHAPMPPPHAASATTSASSAQIAEGHAFYTQSCASCHGARGQGVTGPGLAGLRDSDASIAATIKNGFPPAMPAFGDRYQPAQIQKIVGYVRTLKN